MRIGIIVAMSSEYSYISALLTSQREHKAKGFTFIEGEIDGCSVVMMQCGIGKVNSALGASQMISQFAPDCIISSGVAGGIDPSLEVMDVVVSRRCCYHDVWCGEGNERGQVQGLPLYFDASEELYRKAMSLNGDDGVRLHGGVIVSGDQFITNRAELDVIKSNFPEALAVDMESSSIAQCCYIYGVPFLSCRVISDTPGACKNHTEQYENFWGEIAEHSFTTLERLIRSLV